jgi:RNA polymerase sigma-70 factor (ECF subfamily)
LIRALPGIFPVNSTAPADSDLIRRYLADGDEQCFTDLVARYRDRVLRLSFSILGPGAGFEAEDVTQEAFVVAHRELARFRSESAFSTWLYRIAQRQALKLRRRARYRHAHVDDRVLASLPAAGDSEAAAAERQRHLALYAAVEALEEPLRSTLYLHYWLGESVDSIAELKGARPGTIKSHLHRGRRRLATLLEPEP